MGARLEYLQVPIVFGMGTALTTMVGTNVGAGLDVRAKRVAWTGAGIAACVCGGIGLIAALDPHIWLDIFSRDTEVFEAGRRYLQIVGPVYGLYGLGLALYFAAQGAGRPLWPLIFGCGRLIATGSGALAVLWLGGDLSWIYGAMAAGLGLLGCGTGLSVHVTSWRA
jgi:Na+-driven multidrug efflux pump